MTCSYETERSAEDRDRLDIPESQVRILSPLLAEMALGDFSGGHFPARLDSFSNDRSLTVLFGNVIRPA